MKDDDRQLVNWFKSELKAYLNNKVIIKRLEDQIAELDNRLEYHSPSLTSESHGPPVPHDEQLARYITTRDRFVNQLESIRIAHRAVEAVLEAIPERDRGIIIRVHKGRRTIEGEAVHAGISKNEMQVRIDNQILTALMSVYRISGG